MQHGLEMGPCTYLGSHLQKLTLKLMNRCWYTLSGGRGTTLQRLTGQSGLLVLLACLLATLTALLLPASLLATSAAALLLLLVSLLATVMALLLLVSLLATVAVLLLLVSLLGTPTVELLVLLVNMLVRLAWSPRLDPSLCNEHLFQLRMGAGWVLSEQPGNTFKHYIVGFHVFAEFLRLVIQRNEVESNGLSLQNLLLHDGTVGAQGANHFRHGQRTKRLTF